MKTLLVDSPRVESGALQFQHFLYSGQFDPTMSDFPGVYVRGCEAKALANELGGLLSKAADNKSPLSYALVKKFLTYVYEADQDNQEADQDNQPDSEPEPVTQPVANGRHNERPELRCSIYDVGINRQRQDLEQIRRDFQG